MKDEFSAEFLRPYAHAFEHLNTFAGAFDDLHMDPQCVTGAKIRAPAVRWSVADFFLFQLFDNIHDPNPLLRVFGSGDGPKDRGAVPVLCARRLHAASS